MQGIESLRAKRIEAGIPGFVLCKKAGISRSWLSAIERGYAAPTDEEVQRLTAALDELVRAKRKAEQILTRNGWPAALGGAR